jgi:hypothetical protein
VTLSTCIEEWDISDSESHDIAFSAECSFIPVFFILGGVSAAVLQIYEDMITIIYLTLLGVKSRSSQQRLKINKYLGWGIVPSSSFFIKSVGI